MKKLIAFAVAASVLAVSIFAEEKKHALLIANSEYTHFSGLSEPVKEAENLRDALEQIGFSVKVVKNASLEIMNDALTDFETTLKKSGGTGFFHYGGHAVQVAGKNYLIPSTADIPDERRVSTRALNVDEVMNSMVADTNIVVLDSCRNNPLPAGSGRSASRGLVISSVRPKNSIIVYSAEAGCTARDGVFTPALTKEITRKGVSLQAMLINVRKEVQRLTDGAQTPGEYSQMTDIVYLAGKKEQIASTSAVRPMRELLVTSGMSADVYLDGKKIGHVTPDKPLLQKDINIGIHEVEVRNDKDRAKKTVSINKNGTTNVNFGINQIEIKEKNISKIILITAGCGLVAGGGVFLLCGIEDPNAIIPGSLMGTASILFFILGGLQKNSYHYETRFVSALEKDPVLKNVCFATNGIQTTVGYRFNF